MIKQIDFPPYQRAEIKQIMEDGSILCNLSGENYNDNDILFPAGSTILALTDEEIEQILSDDGSYNPI